MEVSQDYHVFVARQTAKSVAEEAGLELVGVFSVATSVSELASNLSRHTTAGGVLRFEIIRLEGAAGLRVTSEDSGPGISDIDEAMQDGFSTGGSLGSGLPGVERLMDEFEIESEPGVGTRIVATKWQLSANGYRRRGL